jgi:hypothetical protein
MKTLVRIVRSDLGEAASNEVATLVPDLTSDTLKAESAALRLKPILLRLGKVGSNVAIKIITDIAPRDSEEATRPLNRPVDAGLRKRDEPCCPD